MKVTLQIKKGKTPVADKKITRLSSKSTTKATRTVKQLNRDLLKYIVNR